MAESWDIASTSYIQGMTTLSSAGIDRNLTAAEKQEEMRWEFWLGFKYELPESLSSILRKKVRLSSTPKAVFSHLPIRISYKIGTVDTSRYKHITDLYIGVNPDAQIKTPLSVVREGRFTANAAFDESNYSYVIGINCWIEETGLKQNYQKSGNIWLYPNGSVNADGDLVAPLNEVALVPFMGMVNTPPNYV